MGRIQRTSLCNPCVMSLRGPNNLEELCKRIQHCCATLRYDVPKVSRQFHNLLTAISILLTAISISLTTISTYSLQFQLVHGNFNLFTAISIYSRQFQFTHGNFNLFTAISIYSLHGNFNFFTATLTAFFASLTTSQLRRPTVATKSQNAKSKVDI